VVYEETESVVSESQRGFPDATIVECSRIASQPTLTDTIAMSVGLFIPEMRRKESEYLRLARSRVDLDLWPTKIFDMILAQLLARTPQLQNL
jgi:hypothetical protein